MSAAIRLGQSSSLVRISLLHSEGRRFKSCLAHLTTLSYSGARNRLKKIIVSDVGNRLISSGSRERCAIEKLFRFSGFNDRVWKPFYTTTL